MSIGIPIGPALVSGSTLTLELPDRELAADSSA